MDAGTIKALEVIGYYIAGYLVLGGLSALLIGLAYGLIVRKYTKFPVDKDRGRLAAIIGIVERIMYSTSILLGRPEFIGVWLLLKAVGEWKPIGDEEHQMRIWTGPTKEYTVFLIGNAFSVMLGVGAGLLMQGLLPPFPSLKQWQIHIM